MTIDEIIRLAALQQGVPFDISRALFMQESSLNPNAPNGGLGQVLRSTAMKPGYGVSPIDPRDLSDPVKNANFSLQYLKAKAAANGLDINNPAHQAQALRLYNGGGDPNYVSNVMRHIPGRRGVLTEAPDVSPGSVVQTGNVDLGIVAPPRGISNNAAPKPMGLLDKISNFVGDVFNTPDARARAANAKIDNMPQPGSFAPPGQEDAFNIAYARPTPKTYKALDAITAKTPEKDMFSDPMTKMAWAALGAGQPVEPEWKRRPLGAPQFHRGQLIPMPFLRGGF